MVGFLDNISSTSFCQDACSLLAGSCSYFVLDLDAKECQLFDSGKRDCDASVGPAKLTFEECSISTTPTTTTTTIITSTTTATTITTGTTTTTTTNTTTTSTPPTTSKTKLLRCEFPF